MKKILIAIDDSKSAMKAAEYVGQQFAGVADMQIALVHVLPNLPAIFWDEGHILSDEEKRDRKKVVDKWLVDRKMRMEPVLRAAMDTLIAQGIPQAQVRSKFISDSTDAAESILEEARDSGCRTIVVGRKGSSGNKHMLLGSIADRIVSRGSGVAVIIVE